MSVEQLNTEPLLDADFALSLWGDPALFQRLLRQTVTSLNALPDLPTVPGLQGEEREVAGSRLHKYAGRVSVVGMNRLATALRLADNAIRSGQSCDTEIDALITVLADTQQAIADYRAEHEVPYVTEVAVADVDKAALSGLIATMEQAAAGELGTSELDEAVEELFDVVGENPAGVVQEAMNNDDMDAIKAACVALREKYGV